MSGASAIKAPVPSRTLLILNHIFKTSCVELTRETIWTGLTPSSSCVRIHPVSADCLSRGATCSIAPCSYNRSSISTTEDWISCRCLRSFLELSRSCAEMSPRTVNGPVCAFGTVVAFRTGETSTHCYLAPLRVISTASAGIFILVLSIDRTVVTRRTQIGRTCRACWTEVSGRTSHAVRLLSSLSKQVVGPSWTFGGIGEFSPGWTKVALRTREDVGSSVASERTGIAGWTCNTSSNASEESA